jgi:hypothetical protein
MQHPQDDDGVEETQVEGWFDDAVREEVLPEVEKILGEWRGSVPDHISLTEDDMPKKVPCSQCIIEGLDPPELFDRYPGVPNHSLIRTPTRPLTENQQQPAAVIDFAALNGVLRSRRAHCAIQLDHWHNQESARRLARGAAAFESLIPVKPFKVTSS